MKRTTVILLLFTLILSIFASSCADVPAENPNIDTTVSESTSETPGNTERKIYKHVLFVGVDGAGAFFKEAETPNIDRIFKDGNITYEARADYPAKAYLCWTSMLHGAEYSLHKVLDRTYSPYPSDSPFPSVFRAVREQDPNASVTVIGGSFFTVSTTETDFGIETVEANGDFEVAETVCRYLSENDAPTLLFTSFNFPDELGHTEDWGSPAHLSGIRNVDMFIGLIYDKYEEQGILDDTLVIVTSNHGGYNYDHGGNTDGEKYVMFAAAGESVIKNGGAEDMSVHDVSAVVMYALGLDFPENWTARLPAGIFEGVGGEERKTYINDGNTRYREPEPTPGEDSKKYITNFITDKELEYYLPFDGNTEDVCGSKVEAKDDYFFIDGVFGDGIWLDNGYLTVPEYSNGGDAFTITMWIKINGTFGDTPIITNRNRTDPSDAGFTLAINDITGKNKTPSLVVTMGDGSQSDMRPYKVPNDYLDGWIHVIFTCNPEDGMAKISFDFGEFKEIALRDGMTGGVFENGGIFSIGYDPGGENPYSFNGAIDEFMQFDGYFTDGDVAALAAYYGK